MLISTLLLENGVDMRFLVSMVYTPQFLRGVYFYAIAFFSLARKLKKAHSIAVTFSSFLTFACFNGNISLFIGFKYDTSVQIGSVNLGIGKAA